MISRASNYPYTASDRLHTGASWSFEYKRASRCGVRRPKSARLIGTQDPLSQDRGLESMTRLLIGPVWRKNAGSCVRESESRGIQVGAVDKKVRRIDQFRDCDGCLKVAFFFFFLFFFFLFFPCKPGLR